MYMYVYVYREARKNYLQPNAKKGSKLEMENVELTLTNNVSCYKYAKVKSKLKSEKTESWEII